MKRLVVAIHPGGCGWCWASLFTASKPLASKPLSIRGAKSESGSAQKRGCLDEGRRSGGSTGEDGQRSNRPALPLPPSTSLSLPPSPSLSLPLPPSPSLSLPLPPSPSLPLPPPPPPLPPPPLSPPPPPPPSSSPVLLLPTPL